MSSNKFRPHIIILPEDDANRQIAVGFTLNQYLDPKAVQILSVAGGWLKVVELFKTEYISKMREYKERRIVLLIDFDEQNDRLEHIQSLIPTEIKNRVFILGVFSEPEALKRKVEMNFEEIGVALADNCKDQTDVLWSHELLIHNQEELLRVSQSCRDFLFIH